MFFAETHRIRVLPAPPLSRSQLRVFFAFWCDRNKMPFKRPISLPVLVPIVLLSFAIVAAQRTRVWIHRSAHTRSSSSSSSRITRFAQHSLVVVEVNQDYFRIRK